MECSIQRNEKDGDNHFPTLRHELVRGISISYEEGRKDVFGGLYYNQAT